MTRCRSSFCRQGFTLVEAVVVMAVVGLMVAVIVPAIQQQIHRAKLQGCAREAANLLQKARFESIKNNVNAVVEIDSVNNLLFAFADVHGTAATDPGDGLFNPIPAATARTTDYEIGRLSLPPGVRFEYPTGVTDQASIDGFGDTNQAIFRSDGSVQDLGAFRFGDRRNNFLETRVEPAATARIEVRKWHDSSGEWRAFGEGGEPWEWN